MSNNHEIFELTATAGIMQAAWQSGLMGHLLHGEPEPELHPQATLLMGDALIALGIARREQGQLVATEALRQADNAMPGGLMALSMLWGHLPTWLRTGETVFRGVDTGHVYSHVVGSLGQMFAPAAAELARHVGEVDHILDIGAGSGVWSLTMARTSRHTRVTALDLPQVLPGFSAAGRDLGDRISTLPGDVREVELPRVDRVVMGNLLHLFEAEDAQRILQRAAEVSPQIVIVDSMSDGTAQSEVSRAFYALHLAMRRDNSRVHREEVMRGWAAAAGMRVKARLELDPRMRVLTALVLEAR